MKISQSKYLKAQKKYGGCQGLILDANEQIYANGFYVGQAELLKKLQEALNDVAIRATVPKEILARIYDLTARRTKSC